MVLTGAYVVPHEPILLVTVLSTHSRHLMQGQMINKAAELLLCGSRKDSLANDISTLVNVNWKTN